MRVEFENETVQRTVPRHGQAPSGLVGWIMQVSGGAITNKQQAQLLLLIIAGVLIGIAWAVSSFGGPPPVTGPIPEGTSLTVPG